MLTPQLNDPRSVFYAALTELTSNSSFYDWPLRKTGDQPISIAIGTSVSFSTKSAQSLLFAFLKLSVYDMRLQTYPLSILRPFDGSQFDNNSKITYFTVTAYEGDPLLFFNALTGSFVTAAAPDPTVTQTLNGKSYVYISLDKLFFVTPNSIGGPPGPIEFQSLPGDSIAVCVGSGVNLTPNGNTVMIAHDQYWSKSASSYAVAPMARKKVLVDHFLGVTNASSTQTEIAAALEISATASWPTISATISASLSAGITSSNTVTIQDSVDTVSEDIVQSASQEPGIVILWQLVDLLTVYPTEGSLQNRCFRIEAAQVPPIVSIYPSSMTFTAPKGVD